MNRRDQGRVIARAHRKEAQGSEFDPRAYTKSGKLAAALYEPTDAEVADALDAVRKEAAKATPDAPAPKPPAPTAALTPGHGGEHVPEFRAADYTRSARNRD